MIDMINKASLCSALFFLQNEIDSQYHSVLESQSNHNQITSAMIMTDREQKNHTQVIES